MEKSAADVQSDHMIRSELNIIDQKIIWFTNSNILQFPLTQTDLLQKTRKLRQMWSKAFNKLSTAGIWRFTEGEHERYMNPNAHVGPYHEPGC